MLIRFFAVRPALFFGLHALVGCAIFAKLSLWFLLLVPLLNCPLLLRREWKLPAIGLALLVLAFAWSSFRHSLPNCPQEGLQGRAHLNVESLEKSRGPFGAGVVVRGVLRRFYAEDGQIGRNVPVTLYLPARKGKPEAGSEYHLSGRLKLNVGHHTFKLDRDTSFANAERHKWIPFYRSSLKQRLRERLMGSMSDRRSADFLAGLVIGEFTDPAVVLSFRRLGLQHLMAISGFHFSIIAALLALLLRPLFPFRLVAPLLVLLLTVYFLFVGPLPSIERAWIMALLGLLGLIFGRSVDSLGALGVALLLVLFHQPLSVASLGFQFSFACSGALLLFAPQFDSLLSCIIRDRTLAEALTMPLAEKFGFICLIWLRRAVSVILAVHLAAIPLILMHFQRFPLFSMGMNLLFPFLVSLLMVGLFFALLLHAVLPPIGGVLLQMVSSLTAIVLDSAGALPSFFDVYLRCRDTSLLPLVLILVFASGIVVPCLLPSGRLYRSHLSRLGEAVVPHRSI